MSKGNREGAFPDFHDCLSGNALIPEFVFEALSPSDLPKELMMESDHLFHLHLYVGVLFNVGVHLKGKMESGLVTLASVSSAASTFLSDFRLDLLCVGSSSPWQRSDGSPLKHPDLPLATITLHPVP